MNRKKIRFTGLLFLLLLLSGTAIWYFFFYESAEAAIRRTLMEAQELVSKTGSKTPILEATDFRGLQKLMKETITISGSRFASGNFKSDDLLRMFIQGRRFLLSLSTKLYDVEIKVRENGALADVSFSLVITGQNGQHETFREFFDGKAVLARRGRGDWILHAITLEPVIRQHNI